MTINLGTETMARQENDAAHNVAADGDLQFASLFTTEATS